MVVEASLREEAVQGVRNKRGEEEQVEKSHSGQMQSFQEIVVGRMNMVASYHSGVDYGRIAQCVWANVHIAQRMSIQMEIVDGFAFRGSLVYRLFVHGSGVQNYVVHSVV